MVEQKKASVSTVSHHRHHSKIKTNRSTNVIHVTIRKSYRSNSSNNNSRIHRNEQSSSVKKNESSLSPSYKSFGDTNGDMESQFTNTKIKPLDQNGTTKDYHRKIKRKKQKCSRRCWLACAIVTVLVLLIIVSVILILLLKPKSTNTTQITKPAVLQWNNTGILVSGTVGIPGNSSYQLDHPYDITVDHVYNIYVVDHANHRIQKYQLGNTTGQTVAGNGTMGSTPNQLKNPSQILLDSNENFIISEYYMDDVVFWPNGGTIGTANNQLYNPCGLALHPTSGALHIAEYSNNRIMSYAKGASSGTLILGGQGNGTNSTQLYGPAGIYFDSFSNSLLIANSGANNIVRYVLGATGWTLVVGNITGASGITSSSLNGPMKVILDPMGNMYVADLNNNRVQFFYPGQSDGITIAGRMNLSGVMVTTLNGPRSVALDNQLNLYVVEERNYRVQKFLRY